MGIPKMPPEYQQANLCGGNAQFGDIQKKMDDVINNALEKIESSASDLKAKMEVDLADAKDKFSKLQMPKLPSIPDVSLQSEMTSIAKINTNTLIGRLQKEAKKLQVKNLFGDALKEKNIDFESTLKSVEDSIAAGGDACTACKNFMVKAGGKSTDVQEKPSNTMTAAAESSKEEVSTVTTAAKAEGVGLKNIFSFMGDSTPILTDTLSKSFKIMGEGGPNMGKRLESLGKETEEKIKAQAEANGVPIHPGIAKEENELNQNNSLYTVDEAKAKANPTALTTSTDSALKTETGSQTPPQPMSNVELLYNRKMDEWKTTLSKSNKQWQRLNNYAKRCVAPYPKNVCWPFRFNVFFHNANPAEFQKLRQTLDDLGETIFVKGETHIEDMDHEIQNDIDDENIAEGLEGKRTEWEAEFKKAIENTERAGKVATSEFLRLFTKPNIRNSVFAITIPDDGQPGGKPLNVTTPVKRKIEAALIGKGDPVKITKVIRVDDSARFGYRVSVQNEEGKINMFNGFYSGKFSDTVALGENVNKLVERILRSRAVKSTT